MAVFKNVRAALLVSAAGIGLVPFEAIAQSQAQDEEGDVITVTARRRGENLQDVPLSVTAVSGERLEELGTPDLTYIAQTTPNTTLEVSRGTNSTITAFIRGVGQQDPVAGFEAGVGIYIDDVYLNRPQGNVLDVYDVERIEVLRGPQGTLYGRNTIGGAVKYVTKRLGDEPSLSVRGTYGTFNQRDVVLSGELPLSDTFRVGAAVASFNRDGFGENLTTGEENYDKEVISARASAEFEPNELLFVRGTADYLEDNSSTRGGHREIPGQLTGAPVLDDVFDTRGGIEGPNTLEAWGTSLLVELNVSEKFRVKSIAAHRKDDTETQIDFDALPGEDVDVPALYENVQTTWELQGTYEGDMVSGVGGFFYIDANAFHNFDVVLGETGGLISLPGLNANTYGDVDTESWAIFTDISIDLEQAIGWTGFELSVGGRYTEDKRSAEVIRRTFIGGRTPELGGDSSVLIATTSDFEGQQTFDDFSPRLSLSYEPNPDHNLYASYSNGFKGGGFNPRGQSFSAIDSDLDGDVDDADIFEQFLFEPETVNSYELGWKASLLDGRLRSSIAYFFAEYEDVQIPGSIGGIDPSTNANTFIGVVDNAGAAELQGLEMEGTVSFTDNLSGVNDSFAVDYSLGLIDAEYTEYLVAGVDVSDQRVVQNTPESSGSVTTRYERPVAGGTLNFLTVTSYKGDTNQFETPNPLIDQEAYTLFDASLVWTDMTGKYSLGLHGKNLTDEEYRVAGYNFLAQNPDGSITQPITPTLGLEGVATSFYGPPRQVFATLNVKF